MNTITRRDDINEKELFEDEFTLTVEGDFFDEELGQEDQFADDELYGEDLDLGFSQSL